jgi:hypothetical protein
MILFERIKNRFRIGYLHLISFINLVLFLILLNIFSLKGEDVLRPYGEISSAYNDYYTWQPPVNLGIEAGVLYNSFSSSLSNKSNRSFPDNYGKGEGYSPYIFGILDYRLNGFVGLQLVFGLDQINYKSKANTFDLTLKSDNSYDTLNFESDWSKKINYLNAQFLFRYDLSRKFIITLGPFINYKISESEYENKINKNYYINDLIFASKIPQAYSEEQTEKLLFGISAGIAYRYYLADELYLNFQGRYKFSIKNAFKDYKIYPFNENINSYIELNGRQNQMISLGVSLIYKY